MRKFAEGTEVPVARSKAEIEAMLNKYGATRFAYMGSATHAVIVFEIVEIRVRFDLPLPAPDERNAEKETRRRWRALALVIKAKLEMVNSGIVSLEDEFLSHAVMPNGERMGEWAKPQLAIAYRNNAMPPLLEAPKS